MTRDMTDREFLAALKRNRFSKPVMFWCQDLDNPEHHYGMVVDSKGHLYKRQTLASLLRAREETERRNVAIPTPADVVDLMQHRGDAR